MTFMPYEPLNGQSSRSPLTFRSKENSRSPATHIGHSGERYETSVRFAVRKICTIRTGTLVAISNYRSLKPAIERVSDHASKGNAGINKAQAACMTIVYNPKYS